MIDRRHFLIAGSAMLAAGPVAASQLSLNAISAYLNSIKMAKAGFQQINEDGSRASGTLYIQRPGRMRFEYDPPVKLLVMAGGGQVGIFDGKSNLKRAERYPLRRTPLNLILERKVNLARRNMVVGHEFDGNFTVVTAQDPEHPEYGRLQLKFAANPVVLREWVVTDGQGSRTKVVLGDLEIPESLSPSLFIIEREEQARNR